MYANLNPSEGILKTGLQAPRIPSWEFEPEAQEKQAGPNSFASRAAAARAEQEVAKLQAGRVVAGGFHFSANGLKWRKASESMPRPKTRSWRQHATSAMRSPRPALARCKWSVQHRNWSG